MRKAAIVSGVIGIFLLFGTVVCQAQKWDKNGYVDVTVASSYYDTDSIKIKGKLVSWTEKYVLTNEGASFVNSEISKNEVCKNNIEKNGNVTEYQIDFQIENGRKFRGVAKRYYNKDNKLLCTDKDTGSIAKSEWNKILRGSPIQNAKYDLVTKYKVKFE